MSQYLKYAQPHDICDLVSYVTDACDVGIVNNLRSTKLIDDIFMDFCVCGFWYFSVSAVVQLPGIYLFQKHSLLFVILNSIIHFMMG